MSFPPDPITALFKALCPLHDRDLDWDEPAQLSVLVSVRGSQEGPRACLSGKICDFV